MWFACHRRPDRSFFWKGRPFPVCARCTGLYVGYGIGLLLSFWLGPLASFWSVVLIIPLLIDSFTQYWQWRESNNPLRLITGLLAGMGIVLLTIGFAYTAALALTVVDGY